MAFVRKVPITQARGALRQIYDAAVQRAGKVFEILQVQSLNPKSLQAMLGLYTATTTDPQSSLPRWVREAIATVVSKANHCVY